MTVSRREFLQATAGSAAAMTLAPHATTATPRSAPTGFENPPPGPAAHPMRILILGGTTFLGPHQIRYALERGHSISTFTRGRTQPSIHTDLFDHVEQLTGDRDSDLSALENRQWDAVIDNSGQRVEWTRATAELLRDSVQTYVYTSSTGVYHPYLGQDLTEDTQVLLEDPPSEQPRGGPSYGVMKSLSELEARRIFGDDRTVVVRPTYIIGPADPLQRFTYWPLRFAQGGEILVPGRANDPVQYIDVRDLTEFMIRALETNNAGTYNMAGPGSPLGMHAFVHGVHAAVSSDVEWVPVDDYDFLREHSLRFAIPWIMPVDDYIGSARINVSRSKAAGLTYRPLARSAWDTMEWWHSSAVTEERRTRAWSGERGSFAIVPEREKEIIAAWRARR